MQQHPDVPLKIALTDTNNITFYDLDYVDSDFATISIIEGQPATVVEEGALEDTLFSDGDVVNDGVTTIDD